MQFARPVLRIEWVHRQKSPMMMLFAVAPIRFNEARGGEPGADVDDWLRAERELREPADGTDNEAA